ncbi:MAG: glucosamine-6-phosphate deaminase, partial [Spirochaeta sp.]|nr:glucosamine-6-phosphate deaminase [Spirochaeta sp.]
MRIIILKNYEELSRWVAGDLARRILEFEPRADKPFMLGLPTGSSPMGIYQELIRRHRQEELSFKNVVTFNMDEYVGLPENSINSYRFFMQEHFFNHIDIPEENINFLNGNAPDLEAECKRYEEKIKQSGGIHFFLPV